MNFTKLKTTHVLLRVECVKNFQNTSSRGQVISKWDLTGDGLKQMTADQKQGFAKRIIITPSKYSGRHEFQISDPNMWNKIKK